MQAACQPIAQQQAIEMVGFCLSVARKRVTFFTQPRGRKVEGHGARLLKVTEAK
jgi:hypothetical protein